MVVLVILVCTNRSSSRRVERFSIASDWAMFVVVIRSVFVIFRILCSLVCLIFDCCSAIATFIVFVTFAILVVCLVSKRLVFALNEIIVAYGLVVVVWFNVCCASALVAAIVCFMPNPTWICARRWFNRFSITRRWNEPVFFVSIVWVVRSIDSVGEIGVVMFVSCCILLFSLVRVWWSSSSLLILRMTLFRVASWCLCLRMLYRFGELLLVTRFGRSMSRFMLPMVVGRMDGLG